MTIDALNKDVGPGHYGAERIASCERFDFLVDLTNKAFWGTYSDGRDRPATRMRSSYAASGIRAPEDPDQLLKLDAFYMIPDEALPYYRYETRNFSWVETDPDPSHEEDFFDAPPVAPDGVVGINFLSELGGLKPPGIGEPTAPEGGGDGGGSVRPEDGLIYPRKV